MKIAPIIRIVVFIFLCGQLTVWSADEAASTQSVPSTQISESRVATAVTAATSGSPGESDRLPRFILFLGRLHPMVLHFPIGFFVVLFLLETWILVRRSNEMEPAAWLVLFLLCGGAFFAVVFGLFLSWAGDYDPSILFWHKWLGIGLALLTFAAFITKGLWWMNQTHTFQWAYRSILALGLFFMVVGSHQGASLTHGPDYLTRYLPGWLGGGPHEVMVAAANDVHAGSSEFESVIQPILQSRCYECHGDTKQEGGLSLTSRSAVMAGGRSGHAAIAPGDALNSQLVERITLPPENNLVMPPAGKVRLAPNEVMLVMDWINRGAKWFSPLEKLEQSVSPPPPAAVEAIATRGIEVAPLAEGSSLLRVDFTGFSGAPDEEAVTALKQLSEQITWLNLSQRDLSPTVLSALAEFPHLTRLDLSLSNASDGDLQGLAKLTYLESLNLYGTDVSDEGLSALEPLTQLQNLYVWRTQVTKEGTEKLKQAIPGLKIDLGGIDSLPEIASADAPS